jgi:hypothetical protein
MLCLCRIILVDLLKCGVLALLALPGPMSLVESEAHGRIVFSLSPYMFSATRVPVSLWCPRAINTLSFHSSSKDAVHPHLWILGVDSSQEIFKG